ncbi:MAG TPA: ATP-binding protein [Bacteroidota bacterium]|nr:ATP-binding protein [Bacteroidota bacterium]
MTWIVLTGTVVLMVLTGSLVVAVIMWKQKELQLKERQIEELARSERKFRAIFENALAAILRFSFSSSEVIEANHAAFNILGVSTLSELHQVFNTMPEIDRVQFLSMLSTAGKIESFQTKLKRNDGLEVWIILSAVAFPSDGYFEVVFIDVTEKRRLEERNLRTQRIESIGIFSSGLAHDLQNMLVPLKLSLDLLERRLTTDEQTSVLASIRQGVEHGLEMVRHLLAFVRGAEGGHISVELADFMRRLIRSAQEHLPEKIHLSVSYTSVPLCVSGDPVQLRQVFTNLINNACDAMPQGGTISIALEKCEVTRQQAEEIVNGREGSFVKCSVSDTGCGMPPEILDKIFDPFFTTKEVGKGTGLGLSVVAGIIKGHNGFIQVESNVGKGTTFNLYLPAIEFTEEEM